MSLRAYDLMGLWAYDLMGVRAYDLMGLWTYDRMDPQAYDRMGLSDRLPEAKLPKKQFWGAHVESVPSRKNQTPVGGFCAYSTLIL